jgi:hypothetical protein
MDNHSVRHYMTYFKGPLFDAPKMVATGFAK